MVVDGGKKEGLDYQVQEKRRDGLTETEGGSEDDQGKEMKVLKEIATFEEVVVWGHEELVDKDDIFVKGMGEWVQFAEAVGLFRLRRRPQNRTSSMILIRRSLRCMRRQTPSLLSYHYSNISI